MNMSRNQAGKVHPAIIAILPLADSSLDVRIVKGQTVPYVQGWSFPDSSGTKPPLPGPVAYFTREAAGPTTFSTWPGNGDGPPASRQAGSPVSTLPSAFGTAQCAFAYQEVPFVSGQPAFMAVVGKSPIAIIKEY